MRSNRVPDPIGQQRETADGNVFVRSGMQVGRRLDRVIRSYSGGLMSSVVQVGGMLVSGRLG